MRRSVVLIILIPAFFLLQTLIQGSHRFEHPQSSMDGSLAVIFMCLRETKIHEQCIPEVLSNVSVKPMNHL